MQDQDHDRQPDLKSVIADGSFWMIPERQLLDLVKLQFPSELQRLQNATFLKNNNAPRPDGLSISEYLFGQDYAEIDRTLVGVLALRWLWNDDYGTFTKAQGPAGLILKQESFRWLREIFLRNLECSEDIYTLVVSIVINDLGKDSNLAKDYAQLVQVDISKVNHDMILYHSIKVGMIPALDLLTEENKQDVLVGIRLGSEFNFGQLAQAENAPASLAGLAEMRGHDRAFQMRFMEQVLDLAGASGHEDWTCAKKMIEPIFQSYRNVYDVAQAIMDDNVSLREGYDIILIRKLELLRRTGYARQLDIRIPQDRALMRLFCLGNTTNAEEADVYATAFAQRMSEETRQALAHGLNLDGTVEEPAVQATYTPAMLTKAATNTVKGSDDEKVAAVSALLRYLAKCMVVRPDSMERLPKGVIVIERDVRRIMPILESAEFNRNPDILDREDIPEDQVANMAPGY
ncbi:hypothetical protein EDD37DRAFT_83427 [Exophiala viscosa]|uniref:Uncharacterized protein n=1 Tax=Exophiala viscosa TaxID=2486360 RepID=A0AAN6E1A3_9EURO|nr:hypothetical protein EDD36DRAFT_428914 [Exophiala viscosa]KAI1630128.1 hypothetical protein EDD37DRAFT_83427 [Exophiala viscosa]